MSYGVVQRPKADDKKIHYSDSFELCFFRHQYFRKAAYNPTEEEMKPYMGIVNRFVKSTYFTYITLFQGIGMSQDDVASIGTVHIVSYIGLFSLEHNPEKRKEFEEAFASHHYSTPAPDDYLDKNKATFTSFFKQRMEDLVRVCRQKVKNIRGKICEEFTVFKGVNTPPDQRERLYLEHEDFGFKKVDCAVFKKERKNADVDSDATMFQYNGFWYVALTREQAPLSIMDMVGAGDSPYENFHHMQPDEFLEKKEYLTKSEAFNSQSREYQILTIRNFIEKYENKAQYKRELITAKKKLRALEA